MEQTNFIFVDLAEQTDGPKPFDGMAAGEFVDMSGRRAIFKKDDLATYVKNTKVVLASTKDSSGEIVGLPIDAMNHDHREAAGWVVDVELGEGGGVIQFIPRWNPVGVDLISNDVARFFSPTVDISNKSIMGGSLTNWPATRDEKTGKILLRPIELSKQMFELADESLLDKANRIARAFRDSFCDGFETEYAWPVDVFEGYVIVEMGEKLYRVDFKEAGDAFEFAEFEKWVEVKRSYVEAMFKKIEKMIAGLFKQPASDANNGGGEQTTADLPTLLGDVDMTIKLSELAPEDRADLVKEVAGQIRGDVQTPAPVDLAAFLSLEGLSEEAKKQRKAELSAQLAAIRKQAEQEYRAEMMRLEFENRVGDLSNALVTGSEKTPRGLRVSAEDLRAHFLKMDAEEAKWWGELLSNTLDKGFVEFAELGHNRVMQGSQILPAPIASQLRSWLKSGQTIEDFFQVNAVELGNMADYNLAEFQKEK